MRELPFVSIIIVSLNGKYDLNDCLSSLKSLDYPKDRFEIILIDDGSSDETYEFIKENFGDIKTIRNQRNLGAAVSRNTGIKNAKGRLLAFLDDDVKVDKYWLSELVKIMEEDEQIGICASKLLFKEEPEILNSTGGVMNIYGDAWDRGVFEKDNGQYDSQKRVFFACSAAMLVRKEILERTGYFDPALHLYYEDVDLGWRVNLLGYKVIYVPQSKAFHRLGLRLKDNSLKIKYILERNRIRIAAKNYEAKTMLKHASGLLRFKLSRFRIHTQSSRQSRLSLFICALAAWGWNLLYILDTLRERASIQKIKIVPDREVFELLGSYKYESFNS